VKDLAQLTTALGWELKSRAKKPEILDTIWRGLTGESKPKKKRSRRKLTQLALPLALLATLAAVVGLVRRGTGPPIVPGADAAAARPLSTVPEAEAAYHEAMRCWRNGISMLRPAITDFTGSRRPKVKSEVT